MSGDRKEAARKYKETPKPMGVWAVKNKVTGKALVGSSKDLPSMLNRQTFALRSGGHTNRELQKDWNELGADAFEIAAVDTLEPKDEPGWDPADDLRVLEEMWRAKFSDRY